jgi:hypothetical protein
MSQRDWMKIYEAEKKAHDKTKAKLTALSQRVTTDHESKESFIAQVQWCLEQDWEMCAKCGTVILSGPIGWKEYHDCKNGTCA